MHGSGGTVSPSGGSITTGPACSLNRGGPQASFRSTVSDTEVETLQVSACVYVCVFPFPQQHLLTILLHLVSFYSFLKHQNKEHLAYGPVSRR